jgi:Tfp pilus assembly protein PilP
MKKYLTISLGLLLAACTGGEEKDLATKKQQLADYKTEAKELLVKIEQLQKEIAKLDTTVKIEQKSKLTHWPSRSLNIILRCRAM